MTITQRLIAGIASLFVTLFIVELVRRRKLREEYAMLWLASGFVMFLLSVSRGIIAWMAHLLGVEHPAYALFVIALFLGIVLAIHFTVVLSKLTAQNWRLTQEIGLLKHEFEEHQKGGSSGVGSETD